MKIGNFDTSKRVLIIAEIGNNHEGDPILELTGSPTGKTLKFDFKVPERYVNYLVVGEEIKIFTEVRNIPIVAKIDVLDKLEKIKICIGYRVEKEEYSDFPVGTSLASKLLPIYEEIEGWNTSTVGLEKIDQMPLKARAYIQRIEELTETKVSIISTGPERNQTILINNPF